MSAESNKQTTIISTTINHNGYCGNRQIDLSNNCLDPAWQHQPYKCLCDGSYTMMPLIRGTKFQTVQSIRFCPPHQHTLYLCLRFSIIVPSIHVCALAINLSNVLSSIILLINSNRFGSQEKFQTQSYKILFTNHKSLYYLEHICSICVVMYYCVFIFPIIQLLTK